MTQFWTWVQSLDFVTQSAHFFAGWAIILTANKWLRWYWCVLLFVGLYAAPKELIVDKAIWGEDHGTADWKDLLFYVLGTLAACTTIYLGRKKHEMRNLRA